MTIYLMQLIKSKLSPRLLAANNTLTGRYSILAIFFFQIKMTCLHLYCAFPLMNRIWRSSNINLVHGIVKVKQQSHGNSVVLENRTEFPYITTECQRQCAKFTQVNVMSIPMYYTGKLSQRQLNGKCLLWNYGNVIENAKQH